MIFLWKDVFQTVSFATVHERDAKILAKGEASLRFENVHGLPDTSREETYVMVETTAYIEACRHILQGLQSIQEKEEPDEPELPFKNYVVYGEVEMKSPSYLDGKEQTTYDLSCLVKGTTSENKEATRLRKLGASRDRDTSEKELDRSGAQNATSVPVLQLKETLGLDASQLRAVQAALTREFAVIQGPPGTGKTHIGLKVVQTLLRNQHVWNAAGVDEVASNPSRVLDEPRARSVQIANSRMEFLRSVV
ncbi:NFX1-type zinc finger-containing protein 1 [Lamellibrachia satsuma]|nr:NFX1-type zinc finger-containing protein 1 [Lamellibrachia satsuma]